MPKESKPRASKADSAAKGTKAKKDPDAPKRGLSAYMFYSAASRDRVKTENPDATFGDLGKIMGAEWKELSDAEKKPFNDQAAADKIRYEKAKAAYESKKE